MISKKMAKALNEQINAELYSAYLYLAMEAYFESLGLSGFAGWMRVQTQEETMHAMKIYDFVNERGGRVLLDAIKKPQAEWDSALAAFKAAYKHEKYVTGLINELMNLAIAEKDHASSSFLQWFVNEQVEEEASVDKVIQKLNLVAKAPGGQFMVDNELGQRVFNPPAVSEE